MNAIEVWDLQKNYGKKEVLKGISFNVNEGEVLGILGPNGAGKTTTLECMEGLKNFSGGNIYLFGKNILKEKRYIKENIGIQLQSSSLPVNITSLEAMELICKWNCKKTRKDLLDTFGLKELYNKQYGEMSTGQKRRLHLALALSNDPKVVFLDEPTAGLDVEGRINLHREIKKLKTLGITLILASHDMAEVEELCDKIIILVNGKILKEGTTREITSTYNKEVKILIKTLKGSLFKANDLKYSFKNSIDENYSVWRTSNISEALLEILTFVKDNEDEVLDVKIEGPSLEERFMEIVEGVN